MFHGRVRLMRSLMLLKGLRAPTHEIEEVGWVPGDPWWFVLSKGGFRIIRIAGLVVASGLCDHRLVEFMQMTRCCFVIRATGTGNKNVTSVERWVQVCSNTVSKEWKLE